MDRLEEIQARAVREAYRERQLKLAKAHVLAAVDCLIDVEGGAAAMSEILAAAQQECCASEPPIGPDEFAREDASVWASLASVEQKTLYLSAILQSLRRTPTVIRESRKKLIATIWQSMEFKDQEAFLNAVSPERQRK